MNIQFDPAKDQTNIAKHGISLARSVEFDWETAFILEDTRHVYGEVRQQAFGFIQGRLHLLVFTMRGMVCRIISLRKTNKRENKRYAELTR